MDNLAHTLAGAALAKVGFERRSPLAMPTLLLAANLPDVDVLAYLESPLFALTFRRGWTHGILAMLLMPLWLASVMLAWDRGVRRRRRPAAAVARFSDLWIIGLIGVLSHSLLDLLNTYGVRLLMPFSGRWFYADTLFIIDPWLSGALALTWVAGAVGNRQSRIGGNGVRRATRVLGLVALAYIAGMYVLGQATRAAAADGAAGVGRRPARLMAAPVPLDPFRRTILFQEDGRYHRAGFDWRRQRRLVPEPNAIAMNFDRPEVRAVLNRPEARAFLQWSRFPAAAVRPDGVRLYDLRYADAETDSWASVLIADRPW
ncbi:MAG TPA: metal-dependent hydrolase [Gemmatimonadales bacterium]|nr:metal-dependent hydrolase [Gemmatimonadales bacterium]